MNRAWRIFSQDRYGSPPASCFRRMTEPARLPELVEILRRERLHPLTAEAALQRRHQALAAGRKAALLVDGRSNRATVRVPAPSRMLAARGIQPRARLLRPGSSCDDAGNSVKSPQ